ncbi:zf-HC2 domain-containing protein [Streptomyces sp. NPDC058739]|uniref:zf-HC2 domain-containing protein n=1 Tax=Streptomyces sp. NPDC058739 TaxID=3346618 RepID=UPI003675542F
MSGVECGQVRERAAELALGVLPARERAEAVAHLDHCPECREHVERLTAVGDGLLALLPGAEPPVGFESRVTSALGLTPAPKRRRHRLRLAAAAVATAVACGFGGWAIGTAVQGAPPAASRPAAAELREAALIAGGAEVGRVYAHAGDEGWVYMSVDLGEGGRGQVRCLLVHADGSTASAGSFPLEGGYGHWGGPADVDPRTVTGARLVAADGSVLATARFPAG